MTATAQIHHEPPSQRRHYRLAVPVQIVIDGETYQTENWSIGGFLIMNFRGISNAGQIHHGHVQILFGDFRIGFETDFRVVRFNPQSRALAAEFTHLHERHRELLKYFSERLIGGEMTAVDETIKRIDIPVTPVSDLPDTAVDQGGPPRRRILRTLSFSMVYLFIGALLTYYIGETLYRNIFKVRVDMAAIVTPERTVTAPIDGVVDEIYYQEGDEVGKKQPLLHLRNHQVLESIELAKIKIQEAQAALEANREKLEAQRRKLESYKRIGMDKLKIADAKVAVLREKLQLAEKRLARLEKLKASGTVSAERYDRTVSEVVGLKADLNIAISELRISQQAVDETDTGRFYTNHRLEGEVAELTSAVREAEQRVALEQDRLRVLQGRLQRLVVLSPVAGRITTIYPKRHQPLEKGDPILVIEQDGTRSVEAFTTAKDLEHLYIGQAAQVIVNGEQRFYDATVTRIERNLLQEIQPNPATLINDEVYKPVRIVLSFDQARDEASLAELPADLPVIVEFDKRSLTEIRHTLTRWMGAFAGSPEQAIQEPAGES